MRIILIALLLLFKMGFAQNLEIVSIESKDRILRGVMGEDLDITLYLQVAERSDNVGYIFSVRGWYQYDKIKTPIPVVGIWTGSKLSLFVSDDIKFKENIINFNYQGETGKQYLGDFMADLKTLSSKNKLIKEAFHLEFEEYRISGDWLSNGKRLWVSLNSNDSRIFKQAKYLKLANGTLFDLSNLGIPSRTNYEIVARANQDKQIILDYSYHANLNYNGRCGGAQTSGKIGLKFDDQYRLQKISYAPLVDCYQELTVDDLEKVSETITKYKTYNYSSSKSLSYLVNTKEASISEVKK